MESLICPLCCNQAFTDHSSLKYHILDIIDNLLCPSCNEKCKDLMDMVAHLEQGCTNLQNTHEKPREPVREMHEEKSNNKTGHKAENEAPIVKKEQTAVDNVGEPNMEYTCEMCNVTFSSVEDHLTKYHEGEEVLLETEEVIGATPYNQEDSVFAEQCFSDDDMFDEDSIGDNSEREDLYLDDLFGEPQKKATHLPKEKSATKHNPNDDRNNAFSALPITTKYILDDGKVRQLTEVEAENIFDRTRIIEIHSCPSCKLQFPNMTHYYKHNCSNAKAWNNRKRGRREEKAELQKVKEEFRYQCTFCLALYSTLQALNDHMKAHLVQDESGMVHKKTITMTLHVCDICDTKFPTFKQLRLHSRMHDPVKSRQIEPPVSYNLMGQLKKENDLNIEQEEFVCSVCNKTYAKEYQDVHMKMHDEEDQFNCLICNKKFGSKVNLEMHEKAHSSTKKFSCSYCKKLFSKYTDLEEHVLKQCQTLEFACHYCGRRFGKPHEKVKHERIHTGEKPHVCEICGKSFRVAYCLTLHMRTHTGTRPYTCHTCGKRFKSHSVFGHHMKTHSEDRNYKCPFCPKAFKTAVHLAGHKNCHTKPFSCTECNRPFASLYAVRAHMETHRRDNNLKYECWICGATYARSFALRDHMKEAHDTAITERSQVDSTNEALEGVISENCLTKASTKNISDQLKHNDDPKMDIKDENCLTMGSGEEIPHDQLINEDGRGEGSETPLQEK